MANILEAFGTSGQTLTCTLATLASAASRQSTVIDNATTLYLDALVVLQIKTGAAGVSATGTVNVYAYASVDGGTTYTDGASGVDGAMTPTSPPNLRLIGIVNAVANATTYVGGPFSVAAAFNGTLPQKWGIVINNGTGAALDATEGNFAKLWQGVYASAV